MKNVKKITVVLLVLMLCFMGIREAAALQLPEQYGIPYLADFQLQYPDGRTLPTNGLVSIRPGNTISLSVIPTQQNYTWVESYTDPTYDGRRRITDAMANQADNRVNLYYSPTTNTLQVTAARTAVTDPTTSDPAMLPTTVTVQIETELTINVTDAVFSGDVITDYTRNEETITVPSTVYPIRVAIVDEGNGDDGGDGGGTCAVAGTGAAALLLPGAALLIKRRKKHQ